MRLTVTAPSTFVWEQINPQAPNRGEIWVRTRLSALSLSSELAVIERGPFPTSLGYQTLGIVEASGPGSTLQVGQRVITTLGHASAGLHQVSRVVPVPDAVADRVALASILGEETHKGIRQVVPQQDERVLVMGAGLLGLLTIFNLTRRGIANVTVVEPDAARRALAEQFGATAVLHGDLPHDAFDVGFECSAAPAGFTELLAHLRPRGRACVLSDGNWGSLVLPPAFHRRELSIVASSDGDDYEGYAAWLWHHAEPLLAKLFEVTLTPEVLPTTYTNWRTPLRPISGVVQWP